MKPGIGLGVAIHAPLSGIGEPSVSFFGQATILDHPFILRGGNATGNWQILAHLEGTIALRHTIESLFGSGPGSLHVPRDFPTLNLSDLSFSFDTRSGDYQAQGRTIATDLPIAGNIVDNATFSLALDSSGGTTRATLQGRGEWQNTQAQFDVQIAQGSSAIRCLAPPYELLIAREATDKGTNVLVVVRPGTNVAVDDIELAWAKSTWTSVPFRSNAKYAAGVTLQGRILLANTEIGRLLQTNEAIRVRIDADHISAEIGQGLAARKASIPLKQANATTLTSSDEPTTAMPSFAESDPSSDSDVDEATNAQWTMAGPLSLATIVDKLSPSSGSSTASSWRDYLGKCLEIENIGLSLLTSPKVGLAVVFDARIQVGSWLGIALRKVSLRIIPDKLPFTDVSVEPSLQSAAIVIDLAPLAKGSAALRYERTDETNTEVLTGMGQLRLFDQMSIGMLVNCEWENRVFRGAFGFVFAKGFAAGPPGFQLTGITGGFGYHRAFVAPATVDEVLTNPMLLSLRQAPDGDAFSDPSRMLSHLRTFTQMLQDRPHARCIAFGIAFKIVEWLDAVALVLGQMQPRQFDLMLMGLADFRIGTSSYQLGHIQLGLLAHWSSADHSLRMLGTLTPQSWLLHRDCKLHGGFAINMWFSGPHAGDFLVALGGYSPLLPVKTHYPALDRLGFTWNAAADVKLFGDIYFALDRYGIQFGGRAGLKFTSTLLDVDAQFSFDVLSTWMPPFFQTKVRVSVQFELRAIVTLRLGLVVDANVYGPPFGAEFSLAIDIGVWQRTFTIRAGSELESAKQSAVMKPADVLAFAKNGQSSGIQLKVASGSMTTTQSRGSSDAVSFAANQAEPAPRFRADGMILNVATTIPIQTVYRQREAIETRHPYMGDQLDIRPLGHKDVSSTLLWDIRGSTNTADWICIPEMSRPLEALWYLPPNNGATWNESGRKAISSIRFEAPPGQYGDVGLSVLPAFDAGSFGMYDHFIPGIQAGSYTLRVEARMQTKGQTTPFHHEVKTLDFEVDAPRFSLTIQEEIRSCSPAHGGTGNYRRMLPHLVLNKRSLPWERSLDPQATSADSRAIPWMALLVLTNDELLSDGARVHDMRVADMLARKNGIIGPMLHVTPDEGEQTVRVLDASAKLLRAVCPRKDELRLLAHVRRVSMEAKHDAGGQKERDFAILTANRLVQPGPNVVLLVSLEGCRQWLEQPDNETSTSRVHLVVLHAWNFVCDEQDSSFAAQVERLDVGMHKARNTSEDATTDGEKTKIAQGYTLIPHAPQGAPQNLAWYRGPLAPMPNAASAPEHLPFESAQTALFVDATTNRLDVSWASAFQLGRLLALNASSFVGALRRWNHLRQLDQLKAKRSSDKRPAIIEEMAQYAASHVLGAESNDAIFQDVHVVHDWIARLRLLQSVPLRYLVPAGTLLPPESMRMFYIDENWVDALTDGALSLSATSSSTPWFGTSNRGSLRETLPTMMPKREGQGSLQAAAAPRCGFLLRSAVLERFPGLEVECWTADSSPVKMEILRQERLGADLLLVLVNGQPGQVRFRLPREALVFSHDSNGIRPRVTHAQGHVLGARDPNTSAIVLDPFLRNPSPAHGVLDVRQLQNQLGGPSDTSSACFALHWLADPDDVVIRWANDADGGLS